MAEHILYLGYWYQRTSLHLSEVYDFLKYGTSPLNLNKEKLQHLLSEMTLKKVSFTIDILEYIELEAEDNIKIRFYEDGLVVMAKPFHKIEEAKTQLSEYYANRFIPAISYLFSLGAPVPKELAKTKSTYTYFLITQHANKEAVDILLKELGEKEYFEFMNEDIAIYRGDTHYVINSNKDFAGIEQLIEMFIFFSEFKAQLHQYLDLHRSVWEKIEKIKEQGAILGRNIEKQRHELESYKKSIELIDGRMEQMGLYISTRSSIVQKSGWGDVLTKVLEFKYENLRHNLDYVKSLWKMTKQYVDSAIQLFNEINQTSTKYAVNVLTIISSVGIVGVILSHLVKTEYPQVSSIGIFYLLLLLSVSFFIHRFTGFIFKSIRYKISNVDYKKEL